ncbi:peptide-methionine (S)-S-oxide reductase MsrA [Galbibacter pacificus]|uniref:Peptide methionine sulfoxide reductase MsrA n=1 Tax=Galbibacter pacificus TaxID=2996052 RepID=A0ABT6FR04_9FLAO|nr:peptide-methionine (S)-S-oxide reductase MsrA [Galbibacter pacificus]MDG3581824.1 peptide-methionine (S)-S-oxide reductase MsrA [Galbibacter pacificus]MDG3585702.1 peptide-methionine (S)-S-oxide reductase MsrA [Galbibacter pacificus]
MKVLFYISILILVSCKSANVPEHNGMAKAYFASGCFWCVEAIYESVVGVKEVVSGYSGGTKRPNGDDIGDHAETVEVIYDPKVVSFSELIEVYFSSQNPTQINSQGPDLGIRYRSIIFYRNTAEKKIAETKKTEWAKKLNAEIAAEIVLFKKFWPADDYHQDFEERNPDHSYIREVSIPRIQQFRQTCPALLIKDYKKIEQAHDTLSINK